MKTRGLFYAAAATTAVAGILHLVMAPAMLNFNPNGAILFLAGGIAQLFWAVPIIRRWGRAWYSTGIGGTIIFAAIWIITRIPANFMTGRGGMVNEMGVAVQVMEWAFVGFSAAILAIDLKAKRASKRTVSDSA